MKHFNGFSVNKNTDRPKSAAAMAAAAAAVPTALGLESKAPRIFRDFASYCALIRSTFYKLCAVQASRNVQYK